MVTRVLLLLASAPSIGVEAVETMYRHHLHHRHHHRHHQHHHHDHFLESHRRHPRYFAEELDAARRWWFQRLRRRARHRQHHRRQLSLAAARATVEEGALDMDADVPPAQVQAVYSHTHPLVVQSLTHMDKKLEDLKSKQGQAQDLSQRIEDSQREALTSMPRGMVLQRLMVGSKAEAVAQNRVLSELLEEKTALERENEAVADKLQAVMKPRMMAVQHELDLKRKAVKRADEDLQRWDDMRAKYKKSALQMLANRDFEQKHVQDMEQAIKESEKQEELAQASYEDARQEAAREVEAYKVSQSRYEAMASKLADVKSEAADAEISVNKMQNVFTVERYRVASSMEYSQGKLQKRIQMAEAQREKAKNKFKLAKERLLAWRAEQKQLRQKVTALRAEARSRQNEITSNRATIFKSASDKAGSDATARSDFHADDWAWSDATASGDLDMVSNDLDLNLDA